MKVLLNLCVIQKSKKNSYTFQHFQYRVLTIRLSFAFWVFTRLMVTGKIKADGIHINLYLKNVLIRSNHCSQQSYSGTLHYHRLLVNQWHPHSFTDHYLSREIDWNFLIHSVPSISISANLRTAIIYFLHTISVDLISVMCVLGFMICLESVHGPDSTVIQFSGPHWSIKGASFSIITGI